MTTMIKDRVESQFVVFFCRLTYIDKITQQMAPLRIQGGNHLKFSSRTNNPITMYICQEFFYLLYCQKR